MSQAQVTLTPAESKRLIAKAVATLPEVKRALREGTVIVGLGTTNAFVAEELLGKRIDRARHVAGVILPEGTCVVPEERRLRGAIIRKGKAVDAKLDDVLDSLTSRDVIFKGANAIDSKGTAGVFVASETGGTIGRIMGHVKARGVKLIVPVGLEKYVPGSLAEVSKIAGISKFDYSTGWPVGLVTFRGRIVTELEAVGILTGAKARAMGAGGVSGAEGSVTLAIEGTAAQIRTVKKLISGIKGETFPKVEASCTKK